MSAACARYISNKHYGSSWRPPAFPPVIGSAPSASPIPLHAPLVSFLSGVLAATGLNLSPLSLRRSSVCVLFTIAFPGTIVALYSDIVDEQSFEEVRSTVLPLARVSIGTDPSNEVWSGKTKNSKGGHIRLLLRLWEIREVFLGADLGLHALDLGFAVDVAALGFKKCYRLRSGYAPKETLLTEINRSNVLAIKAIELEVDYETVCRRLQFNCIGKDKDRSLSPLVRDCARQRAFGDACRRWCDFLLNEKRRQLGCLDGKERKERFPWHIREVDDMPVVVWASSKTASLPSKQSG